MPSHLWFPAKRPDKHQMLSLQYQTSQRQTLHGYYQDTTFAITNTPLYATKENAFTGKKIKLTTMYSKTFKIRVPLILRLTSLLELSLNILSLVLLRMYLEQIFTVSLPKLLCKVTPQVDINILSVRNIIMGYHLLINPVFLLALNKKNQKDSSQTQPQGF